MNKVSGHNGIPAELFQILKDDAAFNMPENLESKSVATGLEKFSFYSSHKKVQCQSTFKLLQISLISHASDVMLKIL